MDCRTARLLLDFHRPRAGELPADEAADLERHLAGCAECDAAGRAERRLDEHFGRAMRDVPMPDQLRERLLGRLKEERSAVLRRKLAWTARGVAVAATLFIGVFLWWHYIGSRPPRLDVETQVKLDFEKYASLSPEKVENWFQENHKVAMIAPRKFEYGYLAEFELATLKGKPVPKLVFQYWDNSGPTRARVYVLKRTQFDFGDLPVDAPDVETLGRKLAIHDCPESADLCYLIIYDGDRLDLLFTEAERTKIRQ